MTSKIFSPTFPPNPQKYKSPILHRLRFESLLSFQNKGHKILVPSNCFISGLTVREGLSYHFPNAYLKAEAEGRYLLLPFLIFPPFPFSSLLSPKFLITAHPAQHSGHSLLIVASNYMFSSVAKSARRKGTFSMPSTLPEQKWEQSREWVNLA